MENAIFTSRSVREFTDQAVEPIKLKALMKAAMAAPSAGNQQPWEFYVATQPNILKKLSEVGQYAQAAGNAPMVIVACNYNRGMRHADFVQQDMAASVQNILLEAVNQGLGAVWMGVAPKRGRMEIVRNILNLPANLDPFALIAVGYAADEGEPEKRFDQSRVHVLNGSTYVAL